MNIKSTLTVLFFSVTLLTPVAVSAAGELRAGIGAGLLYGSLDFTFTYRPENSHWTFGFAHIYNEVEDSLVWTSTEEETYTGPLVKYLVTSEAKGTFYASAGYFDFDLELNVAETGETASDSTTSLFLGAGYTGYFGARKNFFYDVGLMFNTGDELAVETSVRSVETTGMAGGIVIGVRSFQ